MRSTPQYRLQSLVTVRLKDGANLWEPCVEQMDAGHSGWTLTSSQKSG
jgi:hypothetical protein